MLLKRVFVKIVGGKVMKIKLFEEAKSILNLNDFYVVTIWDDEIILQGDYTCKLEKKLTNLGFQQSRKRDDFTELHKGKIKIYLYKN